MFTNSQWRQKSFISVFVIVQQIKEVIANWHENLNKFIIAETL